MGTATLVYYAHVTMLHAKYKPSFFYGEVFLCMKGGKKKERKKKTTVCRISEEIKARAEKGGLSAELGAVGAVCCSTQQQGARGQLALAFSRHPNT